MVSFFPKLSDRIGHLNGITDIDECVSQAIVSYGTGVFESLFVIRIVFGYASVGMHRKMRVKRRRLDQIPVVILYGYDERSAA